MRSIEVKGKTVEEAVSNGLQELNLTRDAVEVTVLQQPEAGSFLGIGRKAAVVRLTEKDKQQAETCENAEAVGEEAVSYTHLTLPTN